MREDGYKYAIAYIRNHLRYARLLRIDHVMGLHRLYWIPEGLSGDRGLYVEYPAEEMYAILSLESHRADAGIVGENLGMVPAEVNRSMSKHNIRQLYVAQYETAVGSGKSVLEKSAARIRGEPEYSRHVSVPGLSSKDTDIDAAVETRVYHREGSGRRRERDRRRVRKALRRPSERTSSMDVSKFLEKSKASIVLAQSGRSLG